MSAQHVAQDTLPREKHPCLNDCICDRPRALVICRACGWLCQNARAKKTCMAHPKTLYLMDIEMCIQCHANSFLLAEVSHRSSQV